MRLERIRGRLPLQKFTGSKYRISVLLSFESDGEKEYFFRKAGVPAETDARVLSAMYLDLDDRIAQASYVTLQWRTGDGKVHEANVPTAKRWKGAVEATRAYLEKRKTIYGY